jgi:superfamily II DNA or RNA helicase/HKD family nuclease
LEEAQAAQRPVRTRLIPDSGDAALVSQWIKVLMERYLRVLPAERRADAQVEIANQVVQLLLGDAQRRGLRAHPILAEDALKGGIVLEHVLDAFGAQDLVRPATPLCQPVLLTGSHGEPSLGDEYQLEMGSADRVDALVSFVTWGGWLQIKDALQRLSDRVLLQRKRQGDAGGSPVIRLITTTYMGNTDARALEAMAQVPGVEVRVSMDPRRSRLHAKAWLFERASGLHTAYIGSANLSKAALGSGVEWTLKITQRDSPHLLDKFRLTFEGLWEDGEFERLDPEDASAWTRLRLVLKQQSHAAGDQALPRSFTLHPFPFQTAILEKLESERQDYGRMNNLVVAATGTGKTVMAALDYARQRTGPGQPPRLLFVAHRKELLEQARGTFQAALRDYSFGEMLVDGLQPQEWSHLFCSIQSLAKADLEQRFPADHWDMVVVDEFHHAAAPSYRNFLDWVRPRLLLGLTATPERSDGLDVLHWFGGRTAAEIRLWDALDRQLLTPFAYFGLADGVSLEEVRWERGEYDRTVLSALYCANRNRAALVAEKFMILHPVWQKACGLGFCVSVEHATFMAEVFNNLGIASRSLTGGTESHERRQVLEDLRKGRLRMVFTCDLLNEGIDIPEVDTLLFLRPTASATVFQQQLGRGLRLCQGKEQTLVLDFVGRARREFRFDRPLAVLTGLHRGQLLKAFQGEHLPKMPRGCTIHLERQAREDLLENLKENLKLNVAKLLRELKGWLSRSGSPEMPSLHAFVTETGTSLEDIWSTGAVGWTPLLRRAGALPHLASPQEKATEESWSRGLGRLLHLDDSALLSSYQAFAAEGIQAAPYGELEERRLAMLHFQTLYKSALPEGQRGKVVLEGNQPRFRSDLGELAKLLLVEARAARPTDEVVAGAPLALHGRYKRSEILAALGRWTWDKQPGWREGVLYLPDQNLDVFAVTLNKDEKRFSPTTRYEDRFISPSLFHWKSQSGTPEGSATGLRYLTLGKGKNRAILFVRENQDQPYLFLGDLKYLRHEGSRPMGIDFELMVPMPAKDFQAWASIVAA